MLERYMLYGFSVKIEREKMSSPEVVKTSSVLYMSRLKERYYKTTNMGRVYLDYPEELPQKYWEIKCDRLIILSPDEKALISKEDLYEIYGGSIFLSYFRGSPEEDFTIGRYYGIWNKSDPEKEDRIRIDILTNNKDFAEKQIKEMYGKKIDWLW